tara:strand:- start:875 stop:1861 length:987 start_codon:yes stop_codon:yes gene_type:complete
MKIRLTHLDGKIPNLALMKLSHWHKQRGDEVYFTKRSRKDMFEPDYDRVYGSSIFTFSEKKQQRFLQSFPNAIVGGTGFENDITIENLIGLPVYEKYDYKIYPDFEHSIGFSQRGCRLKCKFCVVSKKEGKNVHSNWIDEIYRGEPYPKNLLLLDNDFFGQEDWEKKSQDIIDGGYKVSFNQGINIRLVDDQAAETLPHIKYYDPKFKTRRLYTAWDNLGDEKIFLKGAEKLAKNGIPMGHLMVYMLIGFKKNETWDDIFYRFKILTDLGCLPYPMVYNNKDRELKKFQRWVIMRHHQFIPWEEYNVSVRYVGGSKKSEGYEQVDMFG